MQSLHRVLAPFMILLDTFFNNLDLATNRLCLAVSCLLVYSHSAQPIVSKALTLQAFLMEPHFPRPPLSTWKSYYVSAIIQHEADVIHFKGPTIQIICFLLFVYGSPHCSHIFWCPGSCPRVHDSLSFGWWLARLDLDSKKRGHTSYGK